MEAYSGSYPDAYKSSHTLLHSVRKAQAKPWKKAPVAPRTPTPITVYKVDAINFRGLVQQLTGAPEFNQQQLHDHQLVVPPKPVLSSADIAMASSANWYQLRPQSEALELNLSSPTASYNWCSVPLMTRGTITSL